MSYEGTTTSGIPLIGQGTGNKPKFGTMSIAGGGTNATSMTTSNGVVKYDGTSLVTSSSEIIDGSDRLINTAQPCFFAYNNSTVTNVTGDGTSYNCQFNTELLDQGNNFASNTFTAPVSGRYLFCIGIAVGNVGAQTELYIRVISGTTQLLPIYINPTNIKNSGVINYSAIEIVPMNAAQTCTINLISSGSTKTISWLGAAINASPPYFSGYLLC